MKIAIVGPKPVPYVVGGAENLMQGLVDAINEENVHSADLVKLEVQELSFWDLIDSYYHFYQLDLSDYDMIITTKYPAWMVKHPNSVCYMLHTLRGLYDTYHLMNKPMEVEKGCKKVDELLAFMAEHANYESLEEFFRLVFAMRNDKSIPEKYYEFPGPLIRKLVHYMDFCALSQDGVQKLYAISDTVKNRKDYFPAGYDVATIYPPTVMKECTCKKYEHLFFCSRLDSPKRIDMLVRAMKYVKSDVKLYIAGKGPEKEKLEKLAAGDDRIKFLGFVSDEELENYYANAIAIPYFPYDEDYGYITVEAMLHKKPVITTTDAGGPNEFVENGKTGYVVKFDEKEIAKAIDLIVSDRDKARAMGEAGYEIVSKINWKSAVEELLSGIQSPKEMPTRKKVLMTSTFSLYPPMGGGQARAYYLCRELGVHYDVEVVALGALGDQKRKSKVGYGLTEIVVPKTQPHQEKESDFEREVGIPVTDIVIPFIANETPDYVEAILESTRKSDIILVSHPYTYEILKKELKGKILVYEAQDVEYNIKKGMIPNDNVTTRKLLDKLYEVEKECCEKSALITACSEEDKKSLSELYGIPKEKILVIPNGVACSEAEYVDVDKRLKLRRNAGLENEKIGVFMGSWHQPNLEAAQTIIDIAGQCPDVKLLLMGSQCLYFKEKPYPANVGLLGMVSEEEKRRVFSMIDFALNPMNSGSGTNLKMFDYMAAGVPIITTRFGTRGIADKNLFTLAENDELADAINRFDLEEEKERVQMANDYVKVHFDWKVIGQSMYRRLEELLAENC